MKKTLLVTFGAILLLPLGLMAQEDGTDEAPGPLSEDGDTQGGHGGGVHRSCGG